MDNKPQLDDTLKQLHDELERTKNLDPESRRLLQHVQGDIQALLKEPNAASRASLRTSLQAAVAHFEDSHSRLTLTLMQLLDHLAEV